MSMTTEQAIRISKAVRTEGGAAETALRDKCLWEQMTRAAVIQEWGDPREWSAVVEGAKP